MEKKIALKVFYQFPWVLSYLLILVFLSGCSNNDDQPEPVKVAHVSFFHGSPNMPAIDIRANGNWVNNQEVKYGDYLYYKNFFIGLRTIKVYPHNASNVYIDTAFSMHTDKIYSGFITDQLPKPQIVFVEDKWSVPAEGKAMVRFVHLSPDAPTVHLGLDNLENNLFESREFKNVTPFVEIDAGTHTFFVKDVAEEETLVTAPDINLQAGRIYTVLIRGYVNTPAGNTNVLSIQVLLNDVLI